MSSIGGPEGSVVDEAFASDFIAFRPISSDPPKMIGRLKAISITSAQIAGAEV